MNCDYTGCDVVSIEAGINHHFVKQLKKFLSLFNITETYTISTIYVQNTVEYKYE